ncbi:MAG: hypothetical protein M5U01_40420 [Ardenticatenaceae bacterium]|nr:hypothetical protein [Ardenticatenaceae bacterium]
MLAVILGLDLATLGPRRAGLALYRLLVLAISRLRPSFEVV